MNLTELWRNWEAVGAEIKRQKARGEPPNTKKALDYVKQQKGNNMTEHFGSEFELSKTEVLDVIKNYDYRIRTSIPDIVESYLISEHKMIAVINKYLDFITCEPIGIEKFNKIRADYRKGYNFDCPLYMAALEELLFPNDVHKSKGSPRDEEKDWHYPMFVSLLNQRLTYREVREIMNLSEELFKDLAHKRAQLRPCGRY